MNAEYKRTKLACYATNVSMSVVGNISPILFLTFRSLYGISYSLLGLLVLANFVTQLTVDLIFSFFSHRINMKRAVKITPILTVIGLAVYSLSPFLFAGNEYVGIVIGTVIFSASGGFVEVLISPVIAAIPAENPEREMSKLHSVYAWGVVAVIAICTLFLNIFDRSLWWVLSAVLLLIPLSACILFFGAKLPELESAEKASGIASFMRQGWLWLCVLAIFLGGAAECTMAQWCSGYLEGALGIPKLWGDLFGVAAFSLMLGLGRTLYSKYGKNIRRVLLGGAILATVCYLTAALVDIPFIGLLACALTGFAASMLWPGSLIVASEKFPTAGVFIYAMMAAGGDLGASVAPQLVGIITDAVASSPIGAELAANLGITVEQVGMKCGILTGAVFSLLAVAVFTYIYISHNRQKTKAKTNAQE